MATSGEGAQEALNRVAKWRTLFAGWQLGTRPKGEPESDAVRDSWERLIVLRVEVSALAGLLIAKGVFTSDEWASQLTEECEALEAAYRRTWPGISATNDGLSMKLPEAAETMRRRNFKP